jgi:hypothetical protein
MGIEITDHDQLIYEEKRTLLVEQPRGDAWTRRNDSEPELLDKLLELWKKGERFFLTGVVSAPYDGCFHEPNIWLVEPDCDEKTEIVKPLYASGQGLGVDTVWCLGDLLEWVAEQNLLPLWGKDDRVSPRCSQHRMLSPHGRFDSFEAHPGDTFANDLPPTSHYWAHAVKTADSTWGIELEWKCPECEEIIKGGTYECEPLHTGYRGNGGVGVFMEDAMCYECVQKGFCQVCREQGYDSYEGYDRDIAENGWDLCEDHADALFKDCVETDEEDVDLPETVFLGYVDEDDDEVALFDEYDGGEPLPIKVQVDLDSLEAIGLSCASDYLYKNEDWERRLQVPGRSVERCLD